MKFPFFASFVLIIIFLSARIRKINKKDQKEKDSFWTRELEANSVRRKSLEDLSYVEIPEDLIKLVPALESFQEKKCVNFGGVTNTELKFQYGAPNIPLITEYDQNYADLITLLQETAASSASTIAIPILEFAVDIGSDIPATYKLLAQCYLDEGVPSSKFEVLKYKAEKLPESAQKRVMRQLSPLLPLL